MQFQKSKRPIYLHFLDRELRRAEGVRFDDEEILKFLVLAVISSSSFVYSSASLLHESHIVFPKSIQALMAFEKVGLAYLVTNEHSFEEFIQSRQNIYAHRENRYPMYFDGLDDTLWPSSPHIINSSTTSSLKGSLLGWLGGGHQDLGEVRNKLGATILGDFGNKLLSDTGKAVTLDLLLSTTQLENSSLRRNAGRLVSYYYTKRYLDLFDGELLCNIPNLTFYNSLSKDPALNDYYLLSEVLNACLIPEFFVELGQLSIEKLISFITNDYFKFFQVELFSILKALVVSANSRREIISQNLRQFKSLVKLETQTVISTEDFLNKVHLSITSAAHNLSASVQGFTMPYSLNKEQMSKNSKIIVVTTTTLEAKMFLQSMGSIGKNHSVMTIGKLTVWNFGILGSSEILMIKIPDAGSSKASGSTLVINEAISTLKPNYIVMLGIAFGLKKDKQSIGTILVSRELEDYDSAKVGATGVIKRGHRIPPGATLLNRFDSSSINYQANPVELGFIISGSKLVDNREFVDKLKTDYPEAIGGEMEGTGLQSSCQRGQIEWILIKGICDWGYDKQHENKDRDQEIAMKNACDFFIYTIRNYPL